MAVLRTSFVILLAALLTQCTVPKAINESGKVLDKGHVQVGVGQSINLPGAFTKQVINTLKDGLDNAVNDTFVVDQTFHNVTESALAYSLDPLSSSFDVMARVGLGFNTDVGYKYMGGMHVLGVQHELIGDGVGHITTNDNGFYSSIGLQFSGKKFDPPSFANKLTDVLDYELKRREILVTWLNTKVFTTSDGVEFGHFGGGIAYSHTFINYNFFVDPTLVEVVEQNGVPVKQVLDVIPQGKNNYGAFGGFVNFKIGYKYVFLYASLSVFYQDYGTYNLFAGRTYNPKGITVVPSYGIQVNFGKK